MDEKAPNFLKQALGWSYQAPYAGHDGIQLAIGQLFDKENDHLDASVKRVGSTFTPIGFNRILEAAILPNADKIFEAAKNLLDY